MPAFSSLATDLNLSSGFELGSPRFPQRFGTKCNGALLILQGKGSGVGFPHFLTNPLLHKLWQTSCKESIGAAMDLWPDVRQSPRHA